MTRRLFPFLLPALVLFGAGCLPETPGELGNGSFTYFCASDDDLACQNDLFGASGVPDAIAVGAHFDLRFDPDGAASTATLTPASRSILSTELGLGTDTTGFRFTAPGTVAILAKDGAQVIDFVHVTGAALDRITVTDRAGNQVNGISLSSSSFGETLTASPRDDLGQILAGAMQYAWASSDEDVVSVSQGFDPNEISLIPGSSGKATITVTVQGVQTSIPVTVGTVGGAP